jgi:hypothetical protein
MDIELEDLAREIYIRNLGTGRLRPIDWAYESARAWMEDKRQRALDAEQDRQRALDAEQDHAATEGDQDRWLSIHRSRELQKMADARCAAIVDDQDNRLYCPGHWSKEAVDYELGLARKLNLEVWMP